ncbi:MAG TPA: pentapeptide repeat-containing protein [Acetobacteraceae bacterium]
MTIDELHAKIDRGESLRGADLANGSFPNAEFENFDLREADLSECELNGANFRQARLNDATLDDSSLVNANFHGASMYNVTMRGSDIDGARFTHCYGVVDAGFDNRGYRFVGIWHPKEQTWMVKAGCRWFTMEEAEEHWGPDDMDNRDAMARLAVIKAAVLPHHVRTGFTVD